ncbi:DUF2637 domain-containing protein [Streptomyces sp. NPDC058171]
MRLDTRAQTEMAERTLRLVWVIVAGAVLFSVLTVTPLVRRVTPEGWGWTAPILPIVVDVAVVIVVRVDTIVARLDGSAGVWPLALRWLTGGMTLALNVGESALKADWVGVGVHSVAPVLLIVTAEASLKWRRAITAAVERIDREQREHEQRERREREASVDRERAERERREREAREERERVRAAREQQAREEREDRARREREEREDRSRREQAAREERAEQRHHDARMRREAEERAARRERETAREAALKAADQETPAPQPRPEPAPDVRERPDGQGARAGERPALTAVDPVAPSLPDVAAGRGGESSVSAHAMVASPAVSTARPAVSVSAHDASGQDRMGEEAARAAVARGLREGHTQRQMATVTGWSAGWIAARCKELTTGVSA